MTKVTTIIALAYWICVLSMVLRMVVNSFSSPGMNNYAVKCLVFKSRDQHSELSMAPFSVAACQPTRADWYVGSCSPWKGPEFGLSEIATLWI